MIKATLCWSTTQYGYPIELWQAGHDQFTVTYGLQTDQNLDYATACRKLGAALMYALACEGRLHD